MNPTQLKFGVVLAWCLVVLLAGFFGGVRSGTTWIVLGVIAVAPALVAQVLWKPPARSMSESIHDARD